MITGHIRDALEQVRQVQQAVLDRGQFRGYSGWARAASGSMALVVAWVLSAGWYPATAKAHILGWGALFVVAFCLNGGALLYWFVFDPRVKRDVRRLVPILDSISPLLVGGVLTWVLMWHGFYRPLFGMWMCMFGLTNLASRLVLPRQIAFVGAFYLICGIACLLAPGVQFLKPWVMGVVFFTGEWAGGLILHFDQSRYLSFERYKDDNRKREENNEEE